MLAIICQDKDARALLDKLKLESFSPHLSRIAAEQGIDKKHIEAVVDCAHRKFHYIVTQWLHDQGFSVQRIS